MPNEVNDKEVVVSQGQHHIEEALYNFWKKSMGGMNCIGREITLSFLYRGGTSLQGGMYSIYTKKEKDTN